MSEPIIEIEVSENDPQQIEIYVDPSGNAAAVAAVALAQEAIAAAQAIVVE